MTHSLIFQTLVLQPRVAYEPMYVRYYSVLTASYFQSFCNQLWSSLLARMIECRFLVLPFRNPKLHPCVCTVSSLYMLKKKNEDSMFSPLLATSLKSLNAGRSTHFVMGPALDEASIWLAGGVANLGEPSVTSQRAALFKHRL